jgi:hypothetical protein
MRIKGLFLVNTGYSFRLAWAIEGGIACARAEINKSRTVPRIAVPLNRNLDPQQRDLSHAISVERNAVKSVSVSVAVDDAIPRAQEERSPCVISLITAASALHVRSLRNYTTR